MNDDAHDKTWYTLVTPSLGDLYPQIVRKDGEKKVVRLRVRTVERKTYSADPAHLDSVHLILSYDPILVETSRSVVRERVSEGPVTISSQWKARRVSLFAS